jgi:hypothetical protein
VADAPVFVVGMSRSGTTLLSAMLSAHSRLDCGPESHLLSVLRLLPLEEQAGLVDPSTWPDRAADFVADLENRGHRIIEAFGLTRPDILSWLADRPPSIAAILESLTAQHAERVGAARWVEKTPRHLLTLETIREAWPEAFVVRIVRDPRDVAVSLTGMPFAEDTQVGNLVRIDYDDRRSRHFFATDARAMTLRYEDLVTEPVRELGRVCDFIGEDYEPGMLDRSDSATGVTAEHEWWKGSVGGALDTSRVGRWHTEMPPDVQHFAALYLARYLDGHGYEGALRPRARVALVPIGDAVTARDEDLLLDLSRHDLGVVRPSPRRASDLRRYRRLVFVGARGQLDPWRNGSAIERVLNSVGLATLLLVRRLKRRPVRWVRETSRRERFDSDPVEVVIASLLYLFARPVDSDTVAEEIADA